eukprot:CAMPEP_0176495558 /NCGR_PEP_ID=MMETSP0200_2-20121128/10720_1 /TAXON_ID=947934 /ORGANISM="Chaetoceros sp., Strain GSL56" /LENGTH=1176 /DNA_ID=CAMNT_0017893443 /DNA_START=166 /DNA_END=3696 /DNA_ORIENTATION=+
MSPQTQTKTTWKTTDLPPVIKGSSDWRDYKALKLPNGITCVLVHDKESKTTACSVSVGVGASADPRELSGLAHFAEHMCFLGSEEYPKENEFKSYLSAHGGRSNASTSMSQTCFKFDVLAPHAEQAIDIFANFFVCPLFTESGAGREVNAVDSENSKNVSNDGRRRLQILKALADPQHHYSKFSTGNKETLFTNDEQQAAFVREVLLAFHRRHYRPDNMSVVVVGPQPLNELEDFIVGRFAKMKSRHVLSKKDDDESELSLAEKLVEDCARDMPDDSFGSPSVSYNPSFKPELQGGWPLMLTTKPLQSVRQLYLYFPLPPARDLGDRSPYSIMSHLLGHEGPGSCFAVLQDAELVDAISVGPRLAEADQSLMQISVSLTEKGETYWKDVVTTLFQYCRMLEKIGRNAQNGQNSDGGESMDLETLKGIWDEICTIRRLNFHYASPNDAFSFAPNLASSVRKNGTEKCLSLGSLLNESRDTLPLDAFVDFIQRIEPENCIIERCSKSAWEEAEQLHCKNNNYPSNNGKEGVFGLQKEKWYGVDYYLSPIPSEDVKIWKRLDGSDAPKSKLVKIEDLHLPSENRFIPRDLSLCSELPDDAKEGPRISKEMDPPNLIFENIFGRLWHRLDDRYCLPKASICILLRNPRLDSKYDETSQTWTYDASSSIYSSMMMSVFSDALAQETYETELAGLTWHFNKTSAGLILKCSGYSEHLTEFALKILSRFFQDQTIVNKPFLTERYVAPTKDKYLRNFKSYFESRRADTYAAYYTDFLLASRNKGVDYDVEVIEGLSLDNLRNHHNVFISSDFRTDCLYAGNISEKEATFFFQRAHDIIFEAKKRFKESTIRSTYLPGPFERKLNTGEEIHLHFQSQNKEEQNGCVLMTFQSGTPSFKGGLLSTQESLVQSAAVRTLCHMLREPLFNTLRTQEQLGYIVSSYYDRSVSHHPLTDCYAESSVVNGATPIDSIVVNVLSKKVPPPVLTDRIDKFLDTFREKLSNLPDEELRHHTDSLSKKLLKPKRALGEEVQLQLTKITDYAPEILARGKSPSELPWNSSKDLANAIVNLKRVDLINAWDNVVAGKQRSRIVSHVYGSTFPLDKLESNDFEARYRNKSVINLKSLEGVAQKRENLMQYSAENSRLESKFNPFLRRKLFAAVGLVGSTLLVYTLFRKNDDKTAKNR